MKQNQNIKQKYLTLEILIQKKFKHVEIKMSKKEKVKNFKNGFKKSKTKSDKVLVLNVNTYQG